jgi:DNA-binding transcriptional ArsR family regulator
LGNEYRREIVALLSTRPCSVNEIARDLPISRPAVSRHLKVLSQAGLVIDEQSGTRRVYRLDRKHFERFWKEATARFRLFAENTGA